MALDKAICTAVTGECLPLKVVQVGESISTFGKPSQQESGNKKAH